MRRPKKLYVVRWKLGIGLFKWHQVTCSSLQWANSLMAARQREGCLRIECTHYEAVGTYVRDSAGRKEQGNG